MANSIFRWLLGDCSFQRNYRDQKDCPLFFLLCCINYWSHSSRSLWKEVLGYSKNIIILITKLCFTVSVGTFGDSHAPAPLHHFGNNSTMFLRGKKGKEKKPGSQTELSIDDDKTLERVLADIKKRELKTIETLDLQRKGLQTLPPEIIKLYNLKVLHLYDNELKRLPPEIGMFFVCSLTHFRRTPTTCQTVTQ